MRMEEPKLFCIEKLGEPNLGFISVLEENSNLPFDIKRVYWTYFTPNHIERGHHAHKALHQIIVAVSGIIDFTLENPQGNIYEFTLDEPSTCLYIPPGYWRKIRFSHSAVLLCLASEKYNEDDYIRDYEVFKKFNIDG